MSALSLRPARAAILPLLALLLAVAVPASASRPAFASGEPAGHTPGKPATAESERSPAKAGAEPTRDSKDGKLRHGSRIRAPDGTLVVYDNVCGAYRVPGRPGAYWIDDRFYEFTDGLWKRSEALAGPWTLVRYREVPEVAAERHKIPRREIRVRLPSGLEADFDPKLRAYRIAGREGLFLVDATYYRYDSGVWLSAASADGPFQPASSAPVPVPLRKSLAVPDDGTRVKLPDGAVLVYEGGTGLFAVEDRPDAVYHDGTFYERRGTAWFASSRASTGFEEIRSAEVPGSVRSNYHKPGRAKSRKARAKQKKDSER